MQHNEISQLKRKKIIEKFIFLRAHQEDTPQASRQHLNNNEKCDIIYGGRTRRKLFFSFKHYVHYGLLPENATPSISRKRFFRKISTRGV
jgi:hypothetical protein